MKLEASTVELIDSMGSDLSVCNAARVSFHKESKWENDKEEFINDFDLEDKEFFYKNPKFQGQLGIGDQKLVQFLAKHNHWSPFGHAMLSFRIKTHLVNARQLVKHQVGLCVAGDTKITAVKLVHGISNGTTKYRIKDLYAMWNGEIKYHVGDKGRRNVSGHHIRVLNEETKKFEISHILNVISNGLKPVVEITDVHGNTVIVTKEHQMYTAEGWKAAGSLTDTDYLVRDDIGQPLVERKTRDRDSADVIARRSLEKIRCATCGSTENLEADHKIPVSEGGNHDPENLQVLCKPCHSEKSSFERPQTTTLIPRIVKVQSVEDAGEQEVYDLTIDAHHNFLANGFVAHNCWNEVSRRYVDDEPTFFMPESWRTRPASVKQGSSETETVEYLKYEDEAGEGTVQKPISVIVEQHYHHTLQLYEDMLAAGVAPEQARGILPLFMNTEWIWSGSLAAFARVYSLRIDSHAQKEVRDIAEIIGKLIPNNMQHSWAALTNKE